MRLVFSDFFIRNILCFSKLGVIFLIWVATVFYVWLSYAVSLVAVIALIVQSVKQRKTVLQNVLREQQREERLQQANKGNTL